jgi:Double-GTPase 2
MWLVYLVVIVGAIALFAGYVMIVVPLAALVAFAAYSVLLPCAYLGGMGGVLGTRPATLPAPPRWPRRAQTEDPGVLGYFHGPAAADAMHAARVALQRCDRFWGVGTGLIGGSFENPLAAPIGIGGAVGLGIGSVVGMAGFACCAVVHLAVTGTSILGVRGTAVLLRAVDSALLRFKHIRMVCPHCFHRVPYPAYECAACSRRHWDVRPGRLGVLRRRCLCGTALPTLLLFGTARMAAYCPHRGCGKALEHRPGEAPEVVLPLFGAAGAGKTRLLYGMVEQLRAWSREGLLEAEFADGFTAGDLGMADRFLKAGRATPKTVVRLPRSLIIRVVAGRRSRLVHLFDAAGELFYWSERTQELGYLDKADTFLLVVDPLSVESFWEALPAERRSALTAERSKAPSPELAYQQTQQEMEKMGVDPGRCRLAVVFSRADLLDGPADGPGIESWTREELGLGNLVRSAAHHFRQVRYFRTAAVLRPDGSVDASIADLMRWSLGPAGIDLPGTPR